MTQVVSNLMESVDNEGAGLISLEALKKAAAQLPAAQSASRVTIGSCRPPALRERAKLFASKREVAAR